MSGISRRQEERSDISRPQEERSDISREKQKKDFANSLILPIAKQLLVFTVGFFLVILVLLRGHFFVKFATQPYHATVDSAVLAALDLTSQPPNSTSAVRYDLSVDFSMRNHDIFSVWYSEIAAVPFYNGSMLSMPEKWPHTPVGRGRPKNKVAWQKIPFQGTVAVSPAVAAELERERAAGTVHVQLRVSVKLRLKFNIFRKFPSTIYGAYNCWLWFPTPQHAAPAVFDAGTKCWPLH